MHLLGTAGTQIVRIRKGQVDPKYNGLERVGRAMTPPLRLRVCMLAGAGVAQADVVDVKRQCSLCISLRFIRLAVDVFNGDSVHEVSSLGIALHCGLRAPRSRSRAAASP